MNPISNAEESLHSAWMQVQLDWTEVRSRWPDAVGDEFARRFWEKYAHEVPMFLRAMEDLAAAYEETNSADN